MKKSLLLLALFLSVKVASAQAWLRNLPEVTSGKLTLYDYKKAFEDYWAPFKVDKGYYYENGVKKKAIGWKQFNRWAWDMENQVDAQTGHFPEKTAQQVYEAYIKSPATQKHYSPQSANSNVASWTNLGTSTSTGGYAGVGRVNCIAFHPSDVNTYWVGAPAGGLWVTKDNGVTWTCLTDNNNVLGVSDIVIPSDYATSKTIYIATGDKDAFDNRSIGVLKSTDDGATWNATGLTYALSDAAIVTRLLLSPTNNQTLIAATNKGVYKTINGGNTWSTQLTTTSFNDMEYKPGDFNTLYGSTVNGTIYKSSDAGANWTTSLSLASGYRTELAVSPNQTATVYALVGNADYGLYGIYKSVNSGGAFSQVFDGASTNLLGWAVAGDDVGGQGFYDLTMAVSPSDANTVVVGGINSWRSTNGGTDWSIIDHYAGHSNIQAVHADKHMLKYRSNGTLFECNDGGVYISGNDGTVFTDKTNGMVISQMYKLGVSKTVSNEVITGLQDNGTKLLSSAIWADVKGGDGMECLIDYTDVNIQYGTYVNGQIDRTTDHWANVTNIQPPNAGDGAWVTPYIIDPTDHNTLYAGYADVWKTTDKGTTWTKISTMNTDDKLRSMAIAPSDNKVLYVANSFQIWKTTDAGTAWTDVTGDLPTADANITNITIKNNDANTIWLTMSGYVSGGVYQSTDGGSSWTNISSGLPLLPVYSLVQNKQMTTEVDLYAGTELGVYLKRGSDTWKPYNTSLPNVRIGELEIYYDANPANSKLRAATFGRGLWESEVFFEEIPMTYVSSTTTQKNSHSVVPGTNNARILCFEILTNGSLTPYSVSQLTMSMDGTTDINDVSNIKVYYTGIDSIFSSVKQFGSTTSPALGTITFNGTQELVHGKNYFWITYDVKLTATKNNIIDANGLSATVDNLVRTPSVTDPGTGRTIGIECKSLNYLATNAESIAGTYVDLAANGTLITTPDFDDANSSPVNIGFSFDYNCSSFTQFVLNTNGFIKLGNTNPSSAALFFDGADNANNGIFNSADPSDVNLISVFNHDLEGAPGAEYRVNTSGAAPNRVCTIQFKNVRDKTLTPAQQYNNMQFQIRLFETSNVIEFVYGDWTASANASAYKTSACGLKGSGNSNEELLLVNKGSGMTWESVTFFNSNYQTTATLNFGNPIDRPKPDAGRTFRFNPIFNNDLQIGEIYAMGEASINFGNPQIISTNVSNTGHLEMTNVDVTLTVTGDNSFSEVKTIPNIDPGTTVAVDFNTFSPTITGTNNISVSLPTDEFNGNDNRNWTQNTTENSYKYASAETPFNAWGYNAGGEGIFLTKYHLSDTAQVNFVKAFIYDYADNVGQTVYGVVEDENGTILAKSDDYVLQAQDLGTWHSFEIINPPLIYSGNFLSGLAVTASTLNYYALGYQIENPLRNNIYFSSPIGGGSLYEEDPSYSARFMIGATVAPNLFCLAGSNGSANPQGEYISNVSIGSINQASGVGNGGFQNFTSQTTDLEIGAGAAIAVDVMNNWEKDELFVWVDWNIDGDFDDAGENVYSSGASGVAQYTTNIIPPADATVGTTRMRVRFTDSENGPDSTSCGFATWGEVEDYSLNIIPLLPSAGTASADKSTVCSGSSAVLTLTDSKGNVQWQQSANGTNGWTNVTDGILLDPVSYQTANLTVKKYYRAEVSQINAPNIYSSVIAISVKSLPTVTATSSENPVCLGNGIYLLGTGADYYQWSNNVFDGTYFYPTETATYTVTGTSYDTSAAVCSNSAVITVVVNKSSGCGQTIYVNSYTTYPDNKIFPEARNIAPGSKDNVLAVYNIYGAQVDLNSVTLTTAGSYKASDISGFKLYIASYVNTSGDEISSATEIGHTASVGTGGKIIFSGLTQNLENYSNYLLITADLAPGAILGKTINIVSTPSSGFILSDGKVNVDILPAMNVQTIGQPLPEINVYSYDYDTSRVSPGSPGVKLLTISGNVNKANVRLNSITVPTKGSYKSSDVTEFKLWKRNYKKEGDTLLAASPSVASGSNIVFSNLSSQLLMSEGYFEYHITVDLSAKAVAGHTIGTGSFPLSSFIFNEAIQKISNNNNGNDSMPGGILKIITVPAITLSSPPTLAGGVSAGSFDNIIYKLKLSPTGANASVTKVSFTSSGTYQLSDLASTGFKLWRAGEDGGAFHLQNMLGSANAVASGNNIVFDLTDVNIPQDGLQPPVYLFLTADMSKVAVADRTIGVQAVNSYDVKVISGNISGNGAAGGIQTIVVPAIVFTPAGPSAQTVSPGSWFLNAHSVKVEVSGAPATLNGATFQLSGTYQPADFDTTGIVDDIDGIDGLKGLSAYLVYTRENNLDGDGHLLAVASLPLSGGTMTFNFIENPEFNSTIPLGTGYISVFFEQINPSAVLGHTIQLSSAGIVDYSLASGIKSGTTGVGGLQTIGAPTIAISSLPVAPAFVSPCSEHQIIYKIKLDVSNSNAILKELKFVTAGTYQKNDVNNFSLYLSKDDVLNINQIYISGDTTSDLQMNYLSSVSSGDTLTYNNSNYYDNYGLSTGSTRYLLVVANISYSATIGRTINIASVPSVKFVSGTVTGSLPLATGGIQTIAKPSSIALDFSKVLAADIHSGSNNNVIYSFGVIPTGADAAFTNLRLGTGGSFESSDVKASGFKLWYNTTNTFAGSKLAMQSYSILKNGDDLYLNGAANIPAGTKLYFFVTVDIASTAVMNHTININATTSDNFQFCSVSPSGTGEAGGLQTINNNNNFKIAFKASLTGGAAPFTAGFSNSTPNMSLYDFTWYWGDGNTTNSNESRLSHLYQFGGFYDVALIATDKITGYQDTLIELAYIFVNGDACTHTAKVKPGGPVTACQGDIVKLTANTDPSFTYKWNNSSALINGENDSTLSVNQNGFYSVTIFKNNCPVTSAAVQVTYINKPTQPVITSSGAIVPCVGGSVILTSSANVGGTYKWSTGELTQAITVTTSGNYFVSINNGSTCTNTSEPFVINGSAAAVVPICLVTVDTLSKHNIIIWEKPSTSAITSFKIYRVKTNSIDTLLGTVDYAALSEFHDRTCNPNLTQYDYKITAVDTCDTETPKSDAHRTILMTASVGSNQVNLNWNLYVGNTVDQYTVYRKNIDNGTFAKIATLSPASTSYIDNTIPATGIFAYRIEVDWVTSCISSGKMDATYSTTKSNTKSQSISSPNPSDGEGIISNSFAQEVRMYPNPTNSGINLEFPAGYKDYQITIFNLLGEIIYSNDLKFAAGGNAKNLVYIDASGFASGIYYVSIQTEAVKVFKKLVVE